MGLPRLAPLIGLALLSGTTSLLLRPGDPALAAAPSCPKPTAKQCLAPGYVQSSCAKQHVDVCKPVIETALAEDRRVNPGQRRKMLRVGGSEMPRDLRTGRHFPYKGPKKHRGKKAKKTYKPSPAKSKPGTGMIKMVGYEGPVSPKKQGPKTAYHRNISWAHNGKKITSCDEFAYESLHDWSRFVDVSRTCRGRADCLTELGLIQKTPGLDHPMLDTAGRKLDVQISLNKGQLPKNTFFERADKFAFSAGPNGFSPTNETPWKTMAAHLRHGASYHWIGTAPAKGKPGKKTLADSAMPISAKWKTYGDEFDFHRKLRKRTKGLSQAERAEFARRRKLMRELLNLMQAKAEAWDQIQSAAKLETGKMPEVQIPFLTDVSDPFVQLINAQKQLKATQRAARQVKKKLGAGKLRKMPGAGIKSRLVPRAKHGANEFRSLEEIDADLEELGVFAAPSKRGRPSKKQRRAKKDKKKRGRKAQQLRRAKRGKKKGKPKSGAAVGKVMTTPNGDAHIGQFQGTHIPEIKPMSVCGEWNKPGEWTKTMTPFSDLLGYGPISCRIGVLLRHEWARNMAGQASCLDLTDPSCDWSPEMFTQRFVQDLPYASEFASIRNECMEWTADEFGPEDSSVIAVEKRIAKVKKKAAKAKKLLAPFAMGEPSAHGQAYGDSYDENDTWGDKDIFASGYAAGVGWEVKPVASSPKGKVCALEGHAEAKFNVNAWFFGSKQKVVNALGRIAAEKGEAKLDAHVVALGYHLFSQKNDVTLSKAWTASGGKSIDVPELKPSVEIWAGPILVTGSAWGELYFGAEMSANAKANSCANDSLFVTEASLGPTARVTAAAQVGFGISGFLSAGIRGYLDLITLGLPLGLHATANIDELEIGGGMDLTLGSLSGRLALYVEYIIGEDEYDIIKWGGFGPTTIPIFELPTAVLPLVAM